MPDPGSSNDRGFARYLVKVRCKPYNYGMHTHSRTVRAAGWLSVLVALATCAWIFPSTVGATSLTSGREFDYPSGLAFAGGHLWVTNEHGNSVSEIDPATGAWMASLTSGPYGLDAPTAIAANGPDIFVANSVKSISEINANTRQLVRIVFGSKYHFSNPVAITVAGGRVLVLNAGTNAVSITEFSAQNGLLLKTISGSRFSFNEPAAFATSGQDV